MRKTHNFNILVKAILLLKVQKPLSQEKIIKLNPRVYKLTKTMHFYKNTALWHLATPVKTLFRFFEKRETRVKIVKKYVKKSKKKHFLFFFEVFCNLLMKSR